jgi:hypothetical protein
MIAMSAGSPKIRYKIVTASRHELLSQRVNEFIEQGWIPQGGVAVDEFRGFYQSMIKEL